MTSLILPPTQVWLTHDSVSILCFTGIYAGSSCITAMTHTRYKAEMELY